ncbi:hypothetical protein BRE01_21570 [Brevibacillus reuszeri]|uniref:Accessory gene regulator AgrB n=2 Tax=Brevibacillus reuszeri TaxID=54915 RepID=A0A0K9YWZ7_9BACL|nr:accessory gene regulator B family protein [Brevibacillus reuszeri]KNB73196.1 hypothetical protein ADS79_04275 [Brevibacillus reuszeri]GED68455.1 hypothetical protein BRE01_21570 [Brevibacillus reuszeri]
MIEAIALRIATGIKRINPEVPQSVERMEYALIILLNGVTVIIASLLIGAILGTLKATIIFLVAFALLRQVSGGYHLSSALGCAIVSITLAAVVPLIPVTDKLCQIMSGISLILVAWFAPSKIENQSRIPSKYYPLLKAISIAIVLASVFIAWPIITKALFVQSLFLIRKRR